MAKRNFQLDQRLWGYNPVDFSVVNLPPGKGLTLCPVINADPSRYQNKNVVVHVNGGSQASFNLFGRNNCSVLLEVGLLITWGQSIGKVIANWSDSDFTNFANWVMTQVGCKRMTSSFNEAYGAAIPYAVDMNTMPTIAYKLQKALAIAARAMGYEYLGEYSGVGYPLNLDSHMNNSEQYRALLLNDQMALNSLKGTPDPGQLNLKWLGNPYFATDLNEYMPALIDVYFEPGAIYNSADAFILACTLMYLLVPGAFRALGNTTSFATGYGFLCKAQERSTQFFERALPADIGGKYVGGDFPSYDQTVQFDLIALTLILVAEYEGWGAANVLFGEDERLVAPDEQNSDGVYVKQYIASGPGSHNPGHAGYGFHLLNASIASAYTHSPYSGEDMARQAAKAVYKMYTLTQSTTAVFFPVRKSGTSTWGKSTRDCVIDAFQQKSAFAVGYTNGVDRDAYFMFSFGANRQDYEVLGTGNHVYSDTAAAVTGLVGFTQN